MKTLQNARKMSRGLLAVAGLVALAGWVGLASCSERDGSRGVADPEVLFARSMLPAEPEAAWINRGEVYVPAYAGVRLGSGHGLLELAATLSIRNTSDVRPLNILGIEYFDSAGEIVERYLPRPIALKPLAAMEIFVEAADMRAGPGAHFTVHWAAAGPISEPVIESIMLGVMGTQGYSFVSVGRRVNGVLETRSAE